MAGKGTQLFCTPRHSTFLPRARAPLRSHAGPHAGEQGWLHGGRAMLRTACDSSHVAPASHSGLGAFAASASPSCGYNAQFGFRRDCRRQLAPLCRGPACHRTAAAPGSAPQLGIQRVSALATLALLSPAEPQALAVALGALQELVAAEGREVPQAEAGRVVRVTRGGDFCVCISCGRSDALPFPKATYRRPPSCATAAHSARRTRNVTIESAWLKKKLCLPSVVCLQHLRVLSGPHLRASRHKLDRYDDSDVSKLCAFFRTPLPFNSARLCASPCQAFGLVRRRVEPTPARHAAPSACRDKPLAQTRHPCRLLGSPGTRRLLPRRMHVQTGCSSYSFR